MNTEPLSDDDAVLQRVTRERDRLREALLNITCRHFHQAVDCGQCDAARDLLIELGYATQAGPTLIRAALSEVSR